MPGTFPASLIAIDRLTVGPCRIEKQRLVAPYTVRRGKREETQELIYRWEEPVFDPADPVAQNLAALIAAQPALNYGLFCREIELKGPLDEHDRRFLTDAAENTAREIWVNKLLTANPFLVGDAVGLEPRRLEKYLQARMVFDEPAAAPLPAWTVTRKRHAVLSSGGKDSLLSWALLNEIGANPVPIFVNESGRHWYTALNAHRHFTAAVPGTSRVWTNCDRVFSGMLRHLPFIRPDFARVRADIYPVRLWTVAVFLAGAMPLLRKRGIARIAIGDEYDTSRRVTAHGITHYDGLYDQSRWFDNAMTRYFHRKGWGITVFSPLRQLSELLIQKALVERYPDLQRHQVSCHAAHIEAGRVRPCGRCEKCRRIVGMVSALGADPQACGYSTGQIEDCLRTLPNFPPKQEAAAAQHTLALLVERGLVDARVGAKKYPEVLQLRVDAERAPVEGVPVDLRRPLFELLLQHAEGAVQRQGRVWVDLDLLKDPMMEQPYPYERPGAADEELEAEIVAGPGAETAAAAPAAAPDASPPPAPPDDGKPHKRPWVLGELTWPEARERLKQVDVALLPVGALEQHGPHSPLDTDAFDAGHLAMRVAEACSDPKPLVLPLIPYGVSYHHADFPGTISVTNETLARLVYEVGMGAARHGITKLVIVNGHGGNAATLQFAAQMINRDAHIFTCVDTGETSDADVAKIAETPGDVHAGEIETSTTLAVRPHLVEMDRASRFVPRFSSAYLEFTGSRAVEWYAMTKKISPQGVLGDATKASAEKGARIWDVMIRNLVEMIEDLKRLTLDEIWERRY